jgi:hypothetical protein
MTILNDLPADHPLRNKPLFDLGVMYRWKHSQAWLPIGAKFGIGKKTFNQLSSVWVSNDYFGVNEE